MATRRAWITCLVTCAITATSLGSANSSPSIPSLLYGVVQTRTANEKDKPITNREDSHEMRWFFPGQLPAIVNDWFEKTGVLGPIRKDERVDLYLIAGEGHHLGTKLREGELEIKELREAQQIVATGFEGKAEHWTKWGWMYANLKTEVGRNIDKTVIGTFQKETAQALRIEVDKKRRRRGAEFDKNGALVPKEGWISNGVSAELTTILILGKDWWTIAFETVGDMEKPFEGLSQGGRQVFKDYPGPALSRANSYSYPEWIASAVLADNEWTHVVERDAPYYVGGIQQAVPAHGIFPAGTKVALLEHGGSQCRVKALVDNKEVVAWVETGRLREIEAKPRLEEP